MVGSIVGVVDKPDILTGQAIKPGDVLEAYEIDRLVSDPSIKSKAQAVMSAVDSVVLWEGHTNAYAAVHGITIYHISKASQKDADYAYYRSTLDFALETLWDEFLDAYAD